MTRPCHDVAEGRGQHPAGGCSQVYGMNSPGGCGRALSRPRMSCRRLGGSSPTFLSASAEELPAESETELRRELEAVGAGDVPTVDPRHRPLDDSAGNEG
jgi:hypothetical protein